MIFIFKRNSLYLFVKSIYYIGFNNESIIIIIMKIVVKELAMLVPRQWIVVVEAASSDFRLLDFEARSILHSFLVVALMMVQQQRYVFHFVNPSKVLEDKMFAVRKQSLQQRALR